jgi:hypothetical protein
MEIELTHEIIAKLVGGQLEIQSCVSGHLYRGQVSEMAFEGEGESLTLVVKFSWLAMMAGDFNWEVVHLPPFGVGISAHEVFDIEEGTFQLNCIFNGMIALFFPADSSSTLEPSEVRGLSLV